MSKELEEWHFDLVRMTETHLRDDVQVDGSEYVMIGKGWKIQDIVGGGIAFMYRKERNFREEKTDVGRCAMSEDILAVKVECTGEHRKCESLVVIVVYLTVEGEREQQEV
ncbi:hypothetical protein E2C01_073520 [Portunus trituberculatus]|uniref:Uncharacterized protein n=1 Tax=Portunus trituberculatus TaxID=210409 RepID=A0A5B7IAR8_PORTR|nr:hypothetical protein [Portunus trituberculatus]